MAKEGASSQASVEHIFTWAKSQLEERKGGGASSKAVHEQIEALKGRGLEGDRYAARSGTYSGMDFTGQQVTLFDVSQYEEVIAKPRLRHANLDIASLRRNLGLRVNPKCDILTWVGHEVRIGSAVLFVHMHGNPCPILEKTLKAAGFTDCAWDLCGVHAEVVQSGTIRKGDEVVVVGPHQPERVSGPSTLRRTIPGAYLA
jgi:MOSC domain-containing protein YiiM